MNNKTYAISEGELFLAEYLEDKGFRFKKQIKIEGLKGDSKAYRVADLYLKDYKVYIEFFGMWHVSDENKQKYREKKDIFQKNGIPCIYLYPENLGIIEFILHKRLIKTLKEWNMTRQLFRYKTIRFWKNYKWLLMTTPIFWVFCVMSFSDPQDSWTLKLFILSFCLLLTAGLIDALRDAILE